jgi:small-conductance mechanosensitive channel
LIQNFTLPTPVSNFNVEAGVDYESDLNHVEKVTLEVAYQIQTTVKDADPNFKPMVFFHDFGSYSINFSVILQTLNYGANGLVKHEFVKALHQRFNQEKINMPFPIQSVELRNAPPEWKNKKPTS